MSSRFILPLPSSSSYVWFEHQPIRLYQRVPSQAGLAREDTKYKNIRSTKIQMQLHKPISWASISVSGQGGPKYKYQINVKCQIAPLFHKSHLTKLSLTALFNIGVSDFRAP